MNWYETIKLTATSSVEDDLCEFEGTPGIGDLIINGRAVVDTGLTECDLENLIKTLQAFKARYFPEKDTELEAKL